MKDNVCGIIAEYNPIHNGHIYHIRETKLIGKACFVVALMSGNFTQRGTPAILDKWTRACNAVQTGDVDLVLELPYFIATASANYYAAGGVGILEALRVPGKISFGSELGNLEKLRQLSELLSNETDEYKDIFTGYMSEGMSYPKARELAIGDVLGREYAEVLSGSNNILSLEYLNHIDKLTPVTVQRKGSYNDEGVNHGYLSAMAIRKLISENRIAEIKKHVPKAVFNELTDKSFSYSSVDYDQKKAEIIRVYYNLIRGTVLKMDAKELNQIFGAGEGIENRIIKEVRKAGSYEDLTMAIKSKRYTMTAVSRLLNHILMGLKKEDVKKAFKEKSWYTRVLAFNDKGAKLLKEMKTESDVRVITNINKEESLPPMMKYDILASDVYNIITGRDLYKNSDFVVKPYIKS